MALHDRIALQTDCIGLRTDLNAAEVSTEHASRVLKRFSQQKREPLAIEKLRPKGSPGEMCRKQFPDASLAITPFQFPRGTSCQADHKRPSVNEVSFCVIEEEWADRQA